MISYYIEAIATGYYFNLQINAKMLTTTLTETMSSQIINEVQQINLNSLVIQESYVIFIELSKMSLFENQRISLKYRWKLKWDNLAFFLFY